MAEQRLVVVHEDGSVTFRTSWRAHASFAIIGYAFIAISGLAALIAGGTPAGVITWMCGLSLGAALSLLGGTEDAFCAAGRGVLTRVQQIRIVRSSAEGSYRQQAEPSRRLEADGRSWPLEAVVGVDLGELTDGSEDGPRNPYTVAVVLQDEALWVARTGSKDDARAMAEQVQDVFGGRLPLVEAAGPFPPFRLGTSGLLLGACAIGAMLGSLVLPAELGTSIAWCNLTVFLTALGHRWALTRMKAAARKTELARHADARYAKVRRAALGSAGR